MSVIERGTVPLRLKGHPVPVAYWQGDTADKDLVYLHGLGSTSEDFVDGPAELPGYTVTAIDFPGCGRTPYPRGATLTVDDLVELIERVLEELDIAEFVLVAHSLGGAVGLLWTARQSVKVSGFVNVEGNLASEDCGIFSRKIVEHSAIASAEDVLEWAVKELRNGGRRGYNRFAKSLPDHVEARAFVDYCRSLVPLSDEGSLLDTFLGLSVPKMFVHGEDNSGLSYLNTLKDGGVRVESIPDSDHFPLYTNPAAFWGCLQEFLAKCA